MKKIWDVFLAVLKTIEWKPMVYKIFTDAVKPELEKLVNTTESKWDDIALDAVCVLVDKFLKD